MREQELKSELSLVSNEELEASYKEMQERALARSQMRDNNIEIRNQSALDPQISNHADKGAREEQEAVTKEFANLTLYQAEIDRRVKEGKMVRPATMEEKGMDHNYYPPTGTEPEDPTGTEVVD